MQTKIEVFKTNAGLGYEEFAYLLRITQNEYLCVGLDARHPEDTAWVVGEKKNDNFGDLFLQPSDFDIWKSDWYNRDSFLAGFFLEKTFGALHAN